MMDDLRPGHAKEPVTPAAPKHKMPEIKQSSGFGYVFGGCFFILLAPFVAMVTFCLIIGGMIFIGSGANKGIKKFNAAQNTAQQQKPQSRPRIAVVPVATTKTLPPAPTTNSSSKPRR